MNRISAVLACLALLVTALVPSGYMAARAADGTVMIAICNGQSGERVAMSPDHPLHAALAAAQVRNAGHNSGHDDNGDDEPCDMGASPVTGVDAAGVAVTLMIQPIQSQYSTETLTGIFPSGLPPSTGPPIL